jgi:uncharacterized membrane protein YkvA (DUF1232 family)
METQFKDFYDVLRENLDSYRGKYERFVDYGPDLYKLLSDILNEKSLPSEIRIKICAVLGYFVVPFDILPEQIYGPQGYIDDIFLCVYVLKEIEEQIGYNFLDREWEGDEELKDVLNICYENSKNILGNKIDEILRYVGFE